VERAGRARDKIDLRVIVIIIIIIYYVARGRRETTELDNNIIISYRTTHTHARARDVYTNAIRSDLCVNFFIFFLPSILFFPSPISLLYLYIYILIVVIIVPNAPYRHVLAAVVVDPIESDTKIPACTYNNVNNT